MYPYTVTYVMGLGGNSLDSDTEQLSNTGIRYLQYTSPGHVDVGHLPNIIPVATIAIQINKSSMAFDSACPKCFSTDSILKSIFKNFEGLYRIFTDNARRSVLKFW